MKNALFALTVAVAALASVVTAQQVYTAGNGVTLPKVKKTIKAEYTDEARTARIEGTVVVECVVLTTGKVDRAHVTRSLDPTFGLDQQAVKAVSQWEFEPGTKDGKPVAVYVSIEITFTLK